MSLEDYERAVPVERMASCRAMVVVGFTKADVGEFINVRATISMAERSRARHTLR